MIAKHYSCVAGFFVANLQTHYLGSFISCIFSVNKCNLWTSTECITSTQACTYVLVCFFCVHCHESLAHCDHFVENLNLQSFELRLWCTPHTQTQMGKRPANGAEQNSQIIHKQKRALMTLYVKLLRVQPLIESAYDFPSSLRHFSQRQMKMWSALVVKWACMSCFDGVFFFCWNN